MRIEYLADHEQLVPALAQLHYAEWSHMRPGETLEARTARLRSYLGRRQIPTVVVALDDGKLLGSVSLVATDLDTHPHLSPWLASIYVIENQRRSGIGSALVSRIIEEARGTGMPKLYLFTASAEPFFSRLGWSRIENAVQHETPVTVMSYDIAA